MRRKLQKTTRTHPYRELPVIYWKEILREKPRNVFARRPRKMHSSMNLESARTWIERLFGIPRMAIQFNDAEGKTIDQLRATTVKDLQQSIGTLWAWPADEGRRVD